MLALAGVIVAVVATRGGRAGGGPRDELVKRTFAAAGDVDKLTKLMDTAGWLAKAYDCSERDATHDKDKEDKEDNEDMDNEALRELDKDPRKLHEYYGRRELRGHVETTKGLKIELVPFQTAIGDEGEHAGEPVVFFEKTGEPAGEGCVIKSDLRTEEILAKVRVTEGDDTSEQFTDLRVAEVDGAWFLVTPPVVHAGAAKLEKQLKELRDQACKCKDVTCADDVNVNATAWFKSQRWALYRVPREQRDALDAYIRERMACEQTLRGGRAATAATARLAKLTELKERMCACSDNACVDRVNNAILDWSAEFAPVRTTMSRDDVRESDEIDSQLDDCRMNVEKSAIGTLPD